MAFEDWVVEQDRSRSGGQGVVRKVTNKKDRRSGALKILHDEALIRRERRYRFQCEVAALRALGGSGTPVVIEANEYCWEEGSAPLYLVMEFVDGPTMNDLLSKTRPSLDQALAATKAVVETLGHGHRLAIHHRDVKPDNVIMRRGSWSNPVLVDLGMAWNGMEEGRDFITPVGQELGNRFLRLPEYAPKGDHHDARSDLAMAAGLLYYMLCGSAPRLLIDQRGQFPHERPNPGFRTELTSDRRWPAVLRFFHVAFQHTPQLRYQSAEEMCDAISKINEEPKLVENSFQDHFDELRALRETQFHREREAASSAMQEASLLLSNKLNDLWNINRLTAAPVLPSFTDRGMCFRLVNRVSLEYHDDPSVWFYHDVRLLSGRVIASWHMDDLEPVMTYNGSAADGLGLQEALLASSEFIAGEVVGRLVQKLMPPPALDFE